MIYTGPPALCPAHGWGPAQTHKEEIGMPVDVFITFSTAMLILALTPGPGVFASVSQALSSGFRSAFPLIGGLILGDLCFLTLAVFGLSAVAHVLGDLFFLIKLAGGAYLIWLGWRMWTRAPGSFDEARSGAGRTGGQRFLGWRVE